MKKILAVTLNPCVDYTITVPALSRGEKNPVKKARKDVAGKGINVCTLLRNMEMPVIAAGFDFVDGQVRVREALKKRDIPCVLTDVSGYLRTNIKVLDAASEEMTELNENGHPVSPEKAREVREQICRTLDDLEEGSVMVVSGSAPAGVPTSFYGQLIREARTRNIVTILDASGELLRRGVEAGPDLIKPNLDEFTQLIGHRPESVEEIAREAGKICQSGVQYVCVSMGREGAVFAAENGCWYARCTEVDAHIRGLQGAGDALVAAMAMQITQGNGPESMLRMGMAAANASIQLEGSQMAGPLEIAGMIDAIQIERVELTQ